MLRQTIRLVGMGASCSRTLASASASARPLTSLSSKSRPFLPQSSPSPEEIKSSTPNSIATSSSLILTRRDSGPLEKEGTAESLTILSLSLYMKAGVGIPGILDPIRDRVPIGSPSPSSSPTQEYIIPGASNYSGNILEDPVPSLRIPAPIQNQIPGRNIEKQAARLIVIRRIKMNKHKLRKLRKKMHYKWTKIKERRYIRKERAYLDEQLGKIHAAMKFNAKDFVAEVIKKAKEEPLPRKWTDPLMPDWFREQEMTKEARLKRYQKVVNMYLNKGIKIKMPD